MQAENKLSVTYCIPSWLAQRVLIEALWFETWSLSRLQGCEGRSLIGGWCGDGWDFGWAVWRVHPQLTGR